LRKPWGDVMANAKRWMKVMALAVVSGVILLVLWGYLGRSPTRASAPANAWPHDQGSPDVANETLQFVAAQFRDTQQLLQTLSTQQQGQARQLEDLVAQVHTQAAQVQAIKERERQTMVPPPVATSKSAPTDALVDDPAPKPLLDEIEDLARQVTALSPGTPLTTRDFRGHDPVVRAAIPYYTIPANATAIHTTLMTALVGRVPQKGKVHDPYPFKLLLDHTVLAANGLELDALAGMVVSGVAVGDLSPKGARGWITSLTFLFADGTIQTVGQTGADALAHPGQNTLGYLTDPYGNPAIEGTLITDAPRQIGQMMALSAAKGAASALSEAQITQERQDGRLWRDVTGKRTHYLLGQAGSQSIEQVMSWLGDRMASTFDAIFVPAGQAVVIHFTQEIPIDYQPDGRRLVYANTRTAMVRAGLD
jgi:integrating conjugative element protein (TIGR03752 family)